MILIAGEREGVGHKGLGANLAYDGTVLYLSFRAGTRILCFSQNIQNTY